MVTKINHEMLKNEKEAPEGLYDELEREFLTDAGKEMQHKVNKGFTEGTDPFVHTLQSYLKTAINYLSSENNNRVTVIAKHQQAAPSSQEGPVIPVIDKTGPKYLTKFSVFNHVFKRKQHKDVVDTQKQTQIPTNKR